MVRKTKKFMKLQEDEKNKQTKSMAMQEEINKLRKQQKNFITISNTEWYSLFKEEIRNSIAIEGVFANRSDLLDVLEKNKRTSKHKTAAILGYFESATTMYEYAHNQFQENEFALRMADIRQIHTLLMKYEKDYGFYSGDLGGFRRGNIEVAEATFKPTDAFYIREAMELLVRWANKKIKDTKVSRIELASIIHIWFETIHPFRDGNGRAGRILLSYILIGCGLVNVAIKGISKTNRQKYYDALEACDECFEEISRKLENGKKLGLSYIDKIIQEVSFDPFGTMVTKALDKAVNRLKHSRRIDFSDNAEMPLRDLARAYDYSQDYLRNLINRGQLRASKHGKLWYVRIKDMQKYIKSISKNKH